MSTLVRLKPSVSVIFSKTGEILLKHRKSLRLRGLKKDQTDLLKQLRDGLSRARLDELRKEIAYKKLLTELESRGLLSESPKESHPQLGTFLERQHDFLSAHYSQPELAQERLSNARILVIGCGGTGSQVVQCLVGAGVRSYVLVDPDQVHAPNLNRQWAYTPRQEGTPKVQALRDYIRERIPDAEVQAIQSAIDSTQSVFRLIYQFRPSIVLCGADAPPLLCHLWVAEAALQTEVPCLFGGVGLFDASIGPLLESKESKLRYVRALQGLLDQHSEGLQVVSGSIGTLNSAVSALMAHEIILFLSGIETPRTLGVTLQLKLPSLEASPLARW
jgi:molybdopterin/thiamine biosynthesis adenylyltransferase